MVIAVIRLRGMLNVKSDIRKTLESLNLRRKFSCTLLPEGKENIQGMLQKSKDYIAFGKVADESVLKALIVQRGRIAGRRDEKLDESSSDAALEALISGEFLPKNVKPAFHLHPPTGGFKGRGIKWARGQGGNLGKWSDGKIETLLRRMI